LIVCTSNLTPSVRLSLDYFTLEAIFINSLDLNFDNFSNCLELNLKVFYELKGLIIELTKCQILELHVASITLTNTVLERLLKLALMYNEIGIGPIPIDQWNEVFESVNKKFGSLNLGNSIDQCNFIGLINQEERNFLYDYVKETLRNGFSHADARKILTDYQDESVAFYCKLTEPEKLTKINLKQKVVPSIQSFQIGNFAKENSSQYFHFLVELILKIEQRLSDKHPQ
jgi:hypothetical protein